MNIEKRLYRSRSNRTIAGICAGIADYFGWDRTLVRIAWIALTFFGGCGILIYCILWLVVPEAG